MPAPLTNAQKRYLSQLARAAWQRAGADADGLNEAEWRRSEVVRACGKFGLRCCGQDDYGVVKGHFLAALGRDGAALRAMVQGDPEANRKRQALWCLRRELGARPMAYAEGILRNMSRGEFTLVTATSVWVWRVVVALRTQARREKTKQT
jgi:hypothetical protein